METPNQQQNRVRKRAPNACVRCRQQKIKCSGAAPCAHCRKKNLSCNFDSEHQKILVTREFLSTLERQAGVSHRHSGQEANQRHFDENDNHYLQAGPSHILPTPTTATRSTDDTHQESEPDTRRESITTDQGFTNPLVSGSSVYVTDRSGQPSYLGTSSNWSFGRRILSIAHEQVYGSPLPAASLLFEGQTYDLGWDGRRTSAEFDDTTLPTSDFALYLINAVKFHCCQLFHLFDEQDFMRNFSNYHNPLHRGDCSDLWHIHYLLILALGKAFIVRVGQNRRPPGASEYVQAMKLLPDSIYLCNDPIQSMEILCCAAIYLQCLDMRASAYSLIGQALRIAAVAGLHTDIQSRHHSESTTERCREIWWTVYLLDCHSSSLMGVPLQLTEHDVSARLPAFSGSAQKSLALSIHVRLAKTTTLILKTVYGEEGRMDRQFLGSVKNALKCLASVNDDRNNSFPLSLKTPSSSISRLSAYLHLFHHQCIILTIRPLLYAVWQKRLEKPGSAHARLTGTVRSLLRVCIASAHETLKTLTALQAQSLLESFIPFDLDSTWSCAVVLLVTKMVDPSLLHKDSDWLPKIRIILEEMVSRGNLVAELRKTELQQLEETLTRLHSPPPSTLPPPHPHESVVQNFDEPTMAAETPRDVVSSHSQLQQFEPLQDWNSDEGFTGDGLIAFADSLDMTTPDWLSAAPLGQLEGCLY